MTTVLGAFRDDRERTGAHGGLILRFDISLLITKKWYCLNKEMMRRAHSQRAICRPHTATKDTIFFFHSLLSSDAAQGKIYGSIKRGEGGNVEKKSAR